MAWLDPTGASLLLRDPQGWRWAAAGSCAVLVRGTAGARRRECREHPCAEHFALGTDRGDLQAWASRNRDFGYVQPSVSRVWELPMGAETANNGTLPLPALGRVY